MKAAASCRAPSAARGPNGVPRGLTPRQEQFVHEYLIDLNATRAAIRAGYSAKTADKQGPRLLTHPEVAAAVQEARKVALKRADLTLDEIVAEARRIGFSNMLDFLTIGPDGGPIPDFSRLSRDHAAALVEVTVEDFKDGRGAGAREIRRVRFKLADKLGALIALGKHLGGFGSKLELTGPPGCRLEIRQMFTMAELDRDERRALRELLDRRLQKRSADDPGSRSAQRRGEPAR
jgi:phage terminase small subunit